MSDPNEALPVDTPLAPEGLMVGKFQEGLVVRVMQSFEDFDGQKIEAGEVLHFLNYNYLAYDGGFTLHFAEKTIRLSFNVDDNNPVIYNEGNAWFQPVEGEPHE